MAKRRLLEVTGVAAAFVLVVLLLQAARTPLQGQSQPDGAGTAANGGAALKTAWGDPDLQGIWNQEFNTPLQRPAQYADREFFTDQERAEFDRAQPRGRLSVSKAGGSRLRL